jgi:hypothetical protein
MNRAMAVFAVWATLPLALASHACGFHDPAGLNRSALNLAFPDALHVHTAVWMAQLQNIIAKAEQPAADDDRPEALRALASYREAVGQLGLFRDRAGARIGERTVPAFTVVLVGPMLWTRFEQSGTELVMTPHVTGPSTGDVVVVTDKPVIIALTEGTLMPRSARQLGLLRFYGEPERVAEIAALVDRLSQSDISTR